MWIHIFVLYASYTISLTFDTTNFFYSGRFFTVKKLHEIWVLCETTKESGIFSIVNNSVDKMFNSDEDGVSIMVGRKSGFIGS